MNRAGGLFRRDTGCFAQTRMATCGCARSGNHCRYHDATGLVVAPGGVRVTAGERPWLDCSPRVANNAELDHSTATGAGWFMPITNTRPSNHRWHVATRVVCLAADDRAAGGHSGQMVGAWHHCIAGCSRRGQSAAAAHLSVLRSHTFSREPVACSSPQAVAPDSHGCNANPGFPFSALRCARSDRL